MLQSTKSIEQADRILDRLEQLCKSDLDHLSFLKHGCLSVQSLTSARQVILLARMQQRWMEIVNTEPEPDGFGGGRVASQVWPDSKSEEVLVGDRVFYSYPIQMFDDEVGAGVGSEARWILCVGFEQSISPSQQEGLQLLIESLNEMLQGRIKQQGKGAPDRLWQDFAEVSRHLLTIEETEGLQRYLVDQLPVLIRATRASLFSFQRSSKQCRLIATSSVSKFDPRSDRVIGLESFVLESILATPQEAGASVVMEQASMGNSEGRKEGVGEASFATPNHVIVPWAPGVGTGKSTELWLLVEWTEKSLMATSLPQLSKLLGAMQTSWETQWRWAMLPRWVKRLSRVRSKYRKNPGLGRWTSLPILALLGVLTVAMFIPTRLVIECPGVLEPSNRSTVHATEDGTLIELFVSDGEKVAQGQKLAQLRSPRLELLIEGVLGEIRSLAEKRNGIRVSMNQIVNGTPDSRSMQTKLSSEALVLDIQEKQAKEKLAFLRAEQESLVLKAGISGVVVGSQLQQELVNKPVKQGEPLIQILDLDGAWRVSLKVLDRDSGYVRTFYRGELEEFEFYFDSDTKSRFIGRVTEITSQIDRDFNQTNYQRVYGSVDRQETSVFPAGASVRAMLICGKQPLWFVWTRPLVEYVQRRFSYFSKFWGQVDEQKVTQNKN